MGTVTAVILTRNEEQKIGDCIRSVDFADEVLIVDDYSTDNTVQIATELGARVVTHGLDGDWSQQRRFGIAQATGEWILFVDADERVTPALQQSIEGAIKSGEKYAYWIRRTSVFHHNTATHGVLRPDKVLRLLPKDGATVEGLVHEAIKSPYPQKNLSGNMLHYTYDNWHQYYEKMNKYSTVAAKQYKERNKSCVFIRDVVLRPMWAFIKVYLLQGGILDGKMGFVLSANHYFYTMMKYAKLYYSIKCDGKL